MRDIDEKKVLGVAEYIDLLNQTIKPLQATVIGEVGSVNQRGQAVYFTLSDKKENAILNCIVWLSRLKSIGITLEEGLEIKTIGNPEIYKPSGKFSLIAQYITPVGEGALKQAFERLKSELENKGYFRDERKRKLPQFVQKVGLITSQTGAAIKDFQKHLGNYGFAVYFYDVRVEGIRSIESIVDAIQWFNENTSGIDVLVITRGGGSLENLQAFNSLEVAKAIYSSKIPILSAIGHERDVTITDLVADVRASVPTHAGKLLTENWDAAVRDVEEIEHNITSTYMNKLENLNIKLSNYQNSFITNYRHHLNQCKSDIQNYRQFLSRGFRNILETVNKIETNFLVNYNFFQKGIDRLVSKIDYYSKVLEVSDPLHNLKQGYSIVKDAGGKVVKSSAQVNINDIIAIRLYKGGLKSKVKEIK